MLARSQRGTRRVAAADFFQGVMATALEEDELVVAAELPLLPEDTVTGFVEFSRRKGDFAIAMALVTYRLENGVDGRATRCDRRSRTACAPIAEETEALLDGQSARRGSVFAAAARNGGIGGRSYGRHQ